MALRKPSVKSKRYDLLLKSLLKLQVSQADIDFVGELPPDTIYIDTREPNEYLVSSIASAIHLGFENPNWDLLKIVPKDSTLVVYCAAGFRSEKICTTLLDMGFTDVYNLYGGLFEWVNRGLPVVNEAGETVKIIHGFSKLWGIWAKGIKKVYNKI